MNVPKIVWKNFKVEYTTVIAGRGFLFVVDNIRHYNICLGQYIKIDYNKYRITGLEYMTGSSKTGIIAKLIIE